MKFSKDEEFKLLSLFDEGCNCQTIADYMGIPYYHVYKYLTEKDLFEKREKYRAKARKRDLTKMFKAGKSVKEMAKETDLSTATISNCLADYGLDVRERNAEKQKAELVGYLEKGLTRAEIAKKMDKSISGIDYMIKKYGLKRDRNKE